MQLVRVNSSEAHQVPIATAWSNLPATKKQYWIIKAAEVKQQHMLQHPGYRFRPADGKKSDKRVVKKGHHKNP